MRRPSLTFLVLLLLLCAASLLSSGPVCRAQAAAGHPLLVGYFPQWAIYNQPQYLVKDLVTGGGAALLDQLDYAQGSVAGGHCSVADPNADLQYTFTTKTSVNGRPDPPESAFKGHFRQLQELKQRFPRLKILISLEGNAAFFAADAQPETRKNFVASCIEVFLKGNFAPGITVPGLFDGFDIDWEYPKQPDAANYTALLEEFRRQMDAYRPGSRLTVAVGPSPHMYPGVDMAATAAIVDKVGVMNYDYAGPWSKTTGMLAPLYKESADPQDRGSVNGSLSQYRAAGVPAEKLLMGLPFYGYGWQHVAAAQHGLFQQGEVIHGDQPYHHVADLRKHSSVYRDPVSHAPWLFNGQDFWTYEDPSSIAFKIDYVRRERLGGVMVWELSGDQSDASLLKAAHHALASTRTPENAGDQDAGRVAGPAKVVAHDAEAIRSTGH